MIVIFDAAKMDMADAMQEHGPVRILDALAGELSDLADAWPPRKDLAYVLATLAQDCRKTARQIEQDWPEIAKTRAAKAAG